MMFLNSETKKRGPRLDPSFRSPRISPRLRLCNTHPTSFRSDCVAFLFGEEFLRLTQPFTVRVSTGQDLNLVTGPEVVWV